ncbi:MAG: hypothetical protein V1865_00555 [bacterium]
MRKLLVVGLLLCTVRLFSQPLPEDWHKMADTAWAIDNVTALSIVAGESPSIATAKMIALSRAKFLGVELLGEEVADTLVSDDGSLKITKSRLYKKISSVMRKERTFKKDNGNILYYLAVRVTVIK